MNLDYNPPNIGRISVSKIGKYLSVLSVIGLMLPWSDSTNLDKVLFLSIGLGWTYLNRKVCKEPYLFHGSVFGEAGIRGKALVIGFWFVVSSFLAFGSVLLLNSGAFQATALGLAVLAVAISNAHYKAVYLRAERGEGYLDD